MGTMSQIYADTKDYLGQTHALRRELRMAASRFQALANGEPAGPFKDLYTNWADQTRKAAERE